MTCRATVTGFCALRRFSPPGSVEFADSLTFRAYRSYFALLQALGPGLIGNEGEWRRSG